MRFLFIVPSIDYGGVELQAIRQINALHRKGYAIYLVVLNDIFALGDTLELPNDRVFILHTSYDTLTAPSVKSSYKVIYPLQQIIKQQRISHVIAHLPYAHFIGRLSKLLYPFFHFIPYHHSMQYAASPLRSPIERLFNTCNQLLARFTDTSNICVSKAVRAHLQEHFFLRKPHILYNSIGNNLVDSSLALAHVQSKSLPLNGNTFTLVVPGRLHPSKGHAFFLTVLQAFLQETPLDPAQLQVFFVGGGLLHQALSAEIQQKQLEKHVHLTGTVPNPLLLSFLTLADVTIIPSIHEGLGIVAIEALQQQCLVLCSDAGGLPEVIVNHQNGFIAPSLDHAAWLAQLSHLYHNRHKTLISPTTLYNTYKNRFSFPQHLQRLIELISL